MITIFGDFGHFSAKIVFLENQRYVSCKAGILLSEKTPFVRQILGENIV
jgi:hypothetical protein